MQTSIVVILFTCSTSKHNTYLISDCIYAVQRFSHTVEPVLSVKRRQNIGLNDKWKLNAYECTCLKKGLSLVSIFLLLNFQTKTRSYLV